MHVETCLVWLEVGSMGSSFGFGRWTYRFRSRFKVNFFKVWSRVWLAFLRTVQCIAWARMSFQSLPLSLPSPFEMGTTWLKWFMLQILASALTYFKKANSSPIQSSIYNTTTTIHNIDILDFASHVCTSTCGVYIIWPISVYSSTQMGRWLFHI